MSIDLTDADDGAEYVCVCVCVSQPGRDRMLHATQGNTAKCQFVGAGGLPNCERVAAQEQRRE